jgi:CBS domain-containing protein
MRAEQVMTTPVATVRIDTPLQAVAGMLVERGIGAAPVVDALGQLIGIVTEADLLRRELGPDPRRHARRAVNDPAPVPETAGDVMSTPVSAVPPDTDVADIARLMLDEQVTRVPVVAGRRLLGIVSRSDLLRIVARTDNAIATDIDRVLEEASIDPRWRVAVRGGTATVRGGPAREQGVVTALLRTVPGVARVTVTSDA